MQVQSLACLKAVERYKSSIPAQLNKEGGVYK